MGTDHDEQGGDPACWAHLLDEEASGSTAPVIAELADVKGVGGAVWSLPHGGDLDANLVRLAPGSGIGEHVNSEVDVLMVIRDGDGELTVDGTVHALVPSSVALVRRGSNRAVRAGGRGVEYLSIHPRRGPLTIKRPPPA